MKIFETFAMVFENYLFWIQEATQALVAATTTPGHHHVRDLDEEEDDNHLQNGDTSRDLRMDSDDIVGKLWFKKVSFHKKDNA